MSPGGLPDIIELTGVCLKDVVFLFVSFMAFDRRSDKYCQASAALMGGELQFLEAARCVFYPPMGGSHNSMVVFFFAHLIRVQKYSEKRFVV